MGVIFLKCRFNGQKPLRLHIVFFAYTQNLEINLSNFNIYVYILNCFDNISLH